MSDQAASNERPDGSTDATEEQREHTDRLSDGSVSGDATTDPDQDSDITSGGEPAPPNKA